LAGRFLKDFPQKTGNSQKSGEILGKTCVENGVFGIELGKLKKIST
jgi:hypothetical protein